MYLPDEDSLLLLESLKYLEKEEGLVLDLGCGSCFLTEKLLKNFNVVASDLDFSVFLENNLNKLKNLAEKNRKKVFFVNCDLLKPFNRVFDYIFFNPPYLVFDEREGYYLDTTGGKKGYEATLRFLDQLINALKIEGKAYLILSNYSKNKVICKIKKERIFEIKIIKHKELLFERIYLAEISYSDLIKHFSRLFDKKKKFKFFSKGKNSVILETKDDWLVKLHKNIKKEFFFLNLIKKRIPIYRLFLPEFYFDEALFIKKIKGVSIYDLNKKIKNKSGEKKKKLLKLKYKALIKSLYITFLLDKAKINKFEMNHPQRHILISDRIYFIDFEKARISDKPKNTTQLIEFIINEAKKDLNIDLLPELVEFLKLYKKSYSYKYLNKIINLLKERIIKKI